MNEYKIILRVREEALSTYFIASPLNFEQFVVSLRAELATNVFMIFQCEHAKTRMTIVKCSDISFMHVEFQEPLVEKEEVPPVVKEVTRGKRRAA